MNHFLKNILILDSDRGRRRTAEGTLRARRIDPAVVQILDIVLIEESVGYWVDKNRYGRSGYWFEKSRLPEFLLDPSRNYQSPSFSDYGIVERVPTVNEVECTCHIAPPCSFCTSLTEEEADIMASQGQEGVRRWRRMSETERESA